MESSKAARAFQRKLYLAWLISEQSHNLGTLQEATGMPRRTLQDTLKSLPDIGIHCEFEQRAGERNNQGRYRISDWGPIDPRWIAAHSDSLADALAVPARD